MSFWYLKGTHIVLKNKTLPEQIRFKEGGGRGTVLQNYYFPVFYYILFFKPRWRYLWHCLSTMKKVLQYFFPVLGQYDEEVIICMRRCFLLDGFSGYFKGMETARLMSMIKFNCTAIWTSFGEFDWYLYFVRILEST